MANRKESIWLNAATETAGYVQEIADILTEALEVYAGLLVDANEIGDIHVNRLAEATGLSPSAIRGRIRRYKET